jgi:predicted transposase/invertase (TIGR01784 family)
VVQGFTKHELELFHQISKDKWQTDMQSRLVYAQEEAREKGLKEGLQEGLHKGLKEGLQEAKKEDVRMLKKHGISPEQIAEFLNLSPDVVLEYLQAE